MLPNTDVLSFSAPIMVLILIASSTCTYCIDIGISITANVKSLIVNALPIEFVNVSLIVTLRCLSAQFHAIQYVRSNLSDISYCQTCHAKHLFHLTNCVSLPSSFPYVCYNMFQR